MDTGLRHTLTAAPGEAVPEGPWGVTVVIPDGKGGQYGADPDTVLFQSRVIDFWGEVNAHSMSELRKQLFILQGQDKEKPIHLWINSPGGSVFDALSVYDVISSLTCPVWTYANGMAASAGSLLFMAGEAGHRYALPNSHGMIHQLRGGGSDGTYTEQEAGVKLSRHLELDRLERIYMHHTGRSKSVIAKWMQNGDRWLTPLEMVEHGLADAVLTTKMDGTPMRGFIPNDRLQAPLTAAEMRTSAEFRRVRAASTNKGPARVRGAKAAPKTRRGPSTPPTTGQGLE